MFYVYIGCFTFGLLYSIVSAVLGGHGPGHAGFDHGGAHGHGGSDNGDVPSPFNPLVMASGISAFGAVGIIGKMGFGMGELGSLLLALALAGIVGAVVFFGVVKLMYSSQSNSTFSRCDLGGMEAEVITPIPEAGLGEIGYVVNGVRCSMPAKSAEGGEIAKGEMVVIMEVAGSIASVSRKISIDEFKMPEAWKE